MGALAGYIVACWSEQENSNPGPVKLGLLTVKGDLRDSRAFSKRWLSYLTEREYYPFFHIAALDRISREELAYS